MTAIGAGTAALLLCAIFLLPLLEAIPQSYEYGFKQQTSAVPQVPDAQVLAHLATNVFPHLHVRAWHRPGLGYVGAETAAVGSIILALALHALWRTRSAQVWFFAVLALFGIALGSG